jgi:hypothetical protein
VSSTETTVTKSTKSNEKVIVFRIKRTEKGARLFFQSPMIEKFFKTVTPEERIQETTGSCYSHVKCYVPEVIPQAGEEATLKIWGNHSLYNYDKVNVSFLRAVGLTQGVTFEIPGVYTTEYINKYTRDLKNAVIAFYKNYLQPAESSMEITVNQIVEAGGSSSV